MGSDGYNYEALASELLRALRGERSQSAFARRLGYKSNIVYSWEAGRAFPTASRALRAAQRTGVDVRAALAYIVRSPIFLCIALLGIANGCGYTILEYEVIRRLAAKTAGQADPLGGFGLLFAALRVAQPLIYSVVELTITSRLLRRVRVSRVFFSAPTAVTIGGGGSASNSHALSESFDSTDSWKGTQNAILLAIALTEP